MLQGIVKKAGSRDVVIQAINSLSLFMYNIQQSDHISSLE